MAGDREGKPQCDVSRGRKRRTVSAAELSTIRLGSHVVQQRSSPALQGGVFNVGPHRWQPTRLPHPWDSLGKNTGVGCHFLLQCMKVKSESEDAQSCPTLSDPMDCSLPGSSIHGIFQARVLEWVAIAFSVHWLDSLPNMTIISLKPGKPHGWRSLVGCSPWGC